MRGVGNFGVASGRDAVFAMPLEDIDPVDAEIFKNGTYLRHFERLRKEDPVHYCDRNEHGPYWSITKYNDIMYVDTNHALFSSEPTITYKTAFENPLPMFIAMDPPRHESRRKAVTPAFTGPSLKTLEKLIRERVGQIMDSLPHNETFDWVDRVSIELTSQMLATLLDAPAEDRRKLIHWSDIATSAEVSDERRRKELLECGEYFTRLWNERVNAPPRLDLISMLAHGEATRNMSPIEFLGNMVLLIIAGNDTTRNSMSGGVLAMHESPKEFEKLRADPALVGNAVSEIIRWQTPLAYMRRTASQDVELRGKTIRKGDKVLMWYVSGNRDDEIIENPDAFLIERARARQHLSFGFGIHRCIGNRLAEMQLRIVWEEIIKRFRRIEVVAEPVRAPSSFANGYSSLSVRIPA
jgi:cytochrome P450